MTLIELIGFVITMGAFFLLVVKQAREERKRRSDPEAYEAEAERGEQEAVKDLLRSLNIQVPEDKPAQKAAVPPPPAPSRNPPQKESAKPARPRRANSVFRDPYAMRTAFEHGQVHVKRKQQQSQVKQILRGANSLKHAMILKEVLGPPKGLE